MLPLKKFQWLFVIVPTKFHLGDLGKNIFKPLSYYLKKIKEIKKQKAEPWSKQMMRAWHIAEMPSQSNEKIWTV